MKPAPLAPPGVGVVAFALVDVDCELPPALVRDWAEAVSIQSQRDFAAPAWGYGCAAAVRVRGSLAEVRPGEVPALLMRSPDLPGAAGYHDGSRVVKVFPLLGELADAPVTLSHEVLERLADPDVSTAVIGPDGLVRLREVCDPVEADVYTVKVSSGAVVRVSSFVGVDYFSGPADGAAAGCFDVLRKVTAAGQIRPRGYQTFWTRRGGFSQVVNGRKRGYRATLDTVSALGGTPTRAGLARLAMRSGSKGIGKGGGLDRPRLVDRHGVELVDVEGLL